jgi:hypothetical protein
LLLKPSTISTSLRMKDRRKGMRMDDGTWKYTWNNFFYVELRLIQCSWGALCDLCVIVSYITDDDIVSKISTLQTTDRGLWESSKCTSLE